jgi:hypothetical protein
MKFIQKLAACALVAVGLAAVAAPAAAATIVVTLPEYNGDGINGPHAVGTFNFAAGLNIVGVKFDGMFGNSVTNSTAVQTVTVDGVTVGSCADKSSFCWTTGPVAFSHVFSAADFGLFADGMANLVSDQTDCCVIRLGQSTLTIETVGVPEPATWGLMIAGFGLMGAALRRTRLVQA